MDASHATAANIRAALARQRLTRADLARKLGSTDMWVARRLNEQVPISIDDLTRIADALGVPAGSLLPVDAA